MYESLVETYKKSVQIFKEKSIDDILISEADAKIKADFSEKIKKMAENEKEIVNQEENTL